MSTKWYVDPSSGDVYFPDETHATNIGETDYPIKDAKEWALTMVSQVGLSNLTDKQMNWLLAITMNLIVIGPPPSQQ